MLNQQTEGLIRSSPMLFFNGKQKPPEDGAKTWHRQRGSHDRRV
jgi:hypothetical protein